MSVALVTGAVLYTPPSGFRNSSVDTRRSCNIKNVRLSDSNSRLSVASQALCPLSHCLAEY